MPNDAQSLMPMSASPPMPPVLEPYYKTELEGKSHLRDYWSVLTKRKWWFIGVFTGIVIATLLLCLVMSPIFKVTTTLQIIQDNPSSLMGGDKLDPLGAMTGTSSMDRFYETQYNILKSPTIALRLMDTLNLKEHPSYKELEQKYPTDPPWVIREKFALDMLDRLKVEPIKNSFLVDVTYKSTDKIMAWKVLEELPKEYLKLSMETREQSYTTLRDWLNKELLRLGHKLEESERSLYIHGQQQDFLSLEDNETNVIVKKYVEVSKLLTIAQADKATKEAHYRQIQEKGADAPLITNHPLITQLRQSLIELEATISGQSKIFGSKFPDYSAVNAKMKDLRQRLAHEVKRLEASVKADFEATSRAEALLQQEYDLQKAKVIDLQNLLVNHHVLKRDFQTNTTLYEGLLSRMKDASVASTMVASNVSVITPAKEPYEPWIPKLALFLALSGVIGSMFGVGAAFFVEYLDDSIKTSDELEKICHIPSLGMIPLVSADLWRLPLIGTDSRNLPSTTTGPFELMAYNNPMSMIGEAIQHIRTSILLSASGSAPKLIMVASGNPAEGKTTVCINLAAVLASPDRRCLIVDCDLRKARVHQIFNQPIRPGLTNYLTGAAAMEDIIRPTDIPNLYFIPAGPIPPNPNELFNSAIFENLLNQLRSEYHHVIIDSPPIIGFADGRTISTFVDGVLFVIKHHYTTRETGRLAIQLLTQNHTRILGGILTMTRLGYGGYYGYYKDYQKYYNSIHPPEDDDFSEGTRPAGP